MLQGAQRAARRGADAHSVAQVHQGACHACQLTARGSCAKRGRGVHLRIKAGVGEWRA